MVSLHSFFYLSNGHICIYFHVLYITSTTTCALHYSFTQDPPNTDDEDEMDDNLKHGGVHVDVDTEIPDNSLRLEMVGVITRSRKHATNSLLERKGKKEFKLSQMGDALKVWAETSKAKIETSRDRTEALLARVELVVKLLVQALMILA